MAEFAENVTDIERVHSEWVQCELNQDIPGILTLCSDDIELWPPDADVVSGREFVSAYLKRVGTRIEKIEISERRIRAADGLAVLTAHFRTTFRVEGDAVSKAVAGTHLWILRKRNGWLVELVTWRSSPSS